MKNQVWYWSIPLGIGLTALLLVVWPFRSGTIEQLRVLAAQFKADNARLEQAASRVEGTIRVYRVDRLVPDAVRKSPVDLNLPCQLEGTIWRDGDTFRLDCTRFHGRSSGVYSIAMTPDAIYEFDGPAGGPLLTVFDRSSRDFEQRRTGIRSEYLSPIDALWSMGGESLDRIWERGNAKLEELAYPPGGFVVSDLSAGASSRLEFGPGLMPFKKLVATAGAGLSSVRLEIWVEHKPLGSGLAPTRVVRFTSPSKGQESTEVVELDLRPLAANSPVTRPKDVRSFLNLAPIYGVEVEDAQGRRTRLPEVRRTEP